MSNGVPAFKEPSRGTPRTTLTVMAVLVGILFLGHELARWRVAGAIPTERETVLRRLGTGGLR